jgi:hypothetical protein
MADWPAVSTVLPVLNEARHLSAAVASVLSQDYPGEIQVVLALGPSSDGTDAIAAGLARADSRVICVPNPTGRTPTALNLAIAASRGAVIARVDGHAELPADYLRVAVETLQRTGADNVGGLMWAEGTTPFEVAVARAMTSRFGVGNAAFHVGGGEGPADTVYLGVFRREALERVGGYDESFVRAQDWEMNYRLRHRLVHAQPARRLPPAALGRGAVEPVLLLRPLATGGDAQTPGLDQPALPRATGRARRPRTRLGRRRSRFGLAVALPRLRRAADLRRGSSRRGGRDRPRAAAARPHVARGRLPDDACRLG